MMLCNVPDKITDIHDLVRVQSVGRLVQNDELGIMDDGLGNADSLLVTSGKILYQSVSEMSNGAFFQCQVYSLVDLVRLYQSEESRMPEVFSYCQVCIKRRLLRQKAYVFFGFYRIFAEIYAIDENISLRLVQNAADDVHGGGFSRTVRSEKPRHPFLVYFETYILYSPLDAVPV